jgi:RNase P/RNase MRP subunit p29
MGEAPSTGQERRTRAPSFTLTEGLDVEVIVPVGEDHLLLSGSVVQLTDTTVTLDMEDGPSALTVAMTRRCVLVWGPEGDERCALVRNGRRVDDVRTPTTIELVLEDVQPLAGLTSQG